MGILGKIRINKNYLLVCTRSIIDVVLTDKTGKKVSIDIRVKRGWNIRHDGYFVEVKWRQEKVLMSSTGNEFLALMNSSTVSDSCSSFLVIFPSLCCFYVYNYIYNFVCLWMSLYLKVEIHAK